MSDSLVASVVTHLFALWQNKDAHYFECSAKVNTGVKELFSFIMKAHVDMMAAHTKPTVVLRKYKVILLGDMGKLEWTLRYH